MSRASAILVAATSGSICAPKYCSHGTVLLPADGGKTWETNAVCELRPIAGRSRIRYENRDAYCFAGCRGLPDSRLPERPARREVLQFERDACKAFLDADVSPRWSACSLPDFTLTVSDGEVRTRADDIDELRSREGPLRRMLKTTACLARLYGNDTAVVARKNARERNSGRQAVRSSRAVHGHADQARWPLAACRRTCFRAD